MQVGFVSAILPDLSLEEVLDYASSEFYQCVEVMCWPRGRADRRYAGVTHIDTADISDAAIDEIENLIDDTGVEISALGYYPNVLSPDKDEAQAALTHLESVIQTANRMELETVTTFIGRDWTLSVDDNWERFREVWPPLVRLAEDLGVRIAIENCPMLFSGDEWPGGKNLAHSPAVWRRMFEEIPSEAFGLNYDPSHLVWQQMDPYQPLWEFKDRIFHVHAKDVRVDRHRLDDVGVLALPTAYHTPKLPGLGDVNWGRFFSILTDVGYDGAVCVEVEDRAYEGSLETRQAALQQSRFYLRNFIPSPEDADLGFEDLDFEDE